MSSVAIAEIVAESFTNLAHLSSHKFESNCRSEITATVFVVDNEESERESLELLICRKGWEPQTFASIDEFAGQQPTLVPSCLILDVSRDCNVLELLKRFAIERPEMPIILIMGCGDVRMAVQAIKAGAIDFLTKPFNEDLLLSAIRQALDRSRVSLARHTQQKALKECYSKLTNREREVMALVVCGMLNKEVGAELDISERTVKGHRGRMMQKMKANSLAELVKMAARLRLSAPLRSTMLSLNPLSSQAVT